MHLNIGDQRFDIGKHRLKKLEIAFDEDGRAGRRNNRVGF